VELQLVAVQVLLQVLPQAGLLGLEPFLLPFVVRFVVMCVVQFVEIFPSYSTYLFTFSF
jgi:hypothetical protein